MPSIFEIVKQPISDADKILQLEQEFKAGASLNDKDPNNVDLSILHNAALNSSERLLSWLLARKPELIDLVSSAGTNVLFYAAKYNNRAAFHFFLKHEKGQELLIATNKSHFTVNMFATFSGDPAMLELTMQYRKDSLLSLDQNDTSRGLVTAFNEAATAGQLKMIEYLYKNFKAPINQGTKNGWNPLQRAAEKGHVEVIRFLIANNADINLPVQNSWGGSALLVAARLGQEQAVATLLELKASLDACANEAPENTNEKWMRHAIHLAAQYGHSNIVRLLLANNVDVNTQTANGNTAVYTASSYGKPAVLAILIDLKASLSIPCEGWHPIHGAAKWGHADIVRLLVANKINVDLPTEDKCAETPISIASSAGNPRVLTALIALGGNIKQINKKGREPIHAAAERGNEETIQLLVEHKADVNQRSVITDKNGAIVTPAWQAASSGNIKALEKLIALGVNCHAQHRFDDYAYQDTSKFLLHEAAHKNQVEVMKLLVNKYKVDINFADLITKQINKIPLRTALHFAAAYGNTATILWLLNNGADRATLYTECNLTPFEAATWHANFAGMIALYDPSSLNHLIVIGRKVSGNAGDSFFVRIFDFTDIKEMNGIVKFVECILANALQPQRLLETLKKECDKNARHEKELRKYLGDGKDPTFSEGESEEEDEEDEEEKLSFPIPVPQETLYVTLAKEHHRFMSERDVDFNEVRLVEQVVKLLPLILTEKYFFQSKKLPVDLGYIILKFHFDFPSAEFLKTPIMEILTAAQEITPAAKLPDPSPLGYRISFWHKINVNRTAAQFLKTLPEQSNVVKIKLKEKLAADPAIKETQSVGRKRPLLDETKPEREKRPRLSEPDQAIPQGGPSQSPLQPR